MLVPTSEDRVWHVVSVTDPNVRILGFLDRTRCVNPIDNTHYAPITTTPSTRTKYFTRTLAQSTSLELSHKALQQKSRKSYFTRTLARNRIGFHGGEY
jgi:hypothetical protein